MNDQTRKCNSCGEEFIIYSSDFDFYKSIEVTPPTWCPTCRLIRRMSFRNERSLYKDECDLCGKSMLSMYAPESSFVVYCKQCWFSDKWNVMDLGIEYDFNKSFFQQFAELRSRVPRLNLMHVRENTNSEYSNYVGGDKNVYLGFSVVNSENVMYSRAVDDSRDCIDCSSAGAIEMCYEAIESSDSSRSQYIFRVASSINCLFLYDCANCQDCFMSTGLRNKRYVFRNKQLTKEEYMSEISKIDMGDRNQVDELKKEYKKVRLEFIYKYANILKSVDSTGDGIIASKNVKNSFDCYNSEDLRYSMRSIGAKQCMDVFGIGTGELVYEAVATTYEGSRIRFALIGDGVRDSEYTDSCFQSVNLFGCISLRNKSYCILNKQYDKESFEKLRIQIIAQMSEVPYIGKNGREYKYGEYFPIEISPFAYNESFAQEYFTLTKNEAVAKGYRWRDDDVRDFKITKMPEELPNNIKDAGDSILNEIIGCSHKGECNEKCTTAFRITPQELQFYKSVGVALPILCPNCRHYERLSMRNPLRTWHGKCMCNGLESDNGVYLNTIKHIHGDQHCPNEFETPYSPESPSITYCEQCYQQEVS